MPISSSCCRSEEDSVAVLYYNSLDFLPCSFPGVREKRGTKKNKNKKKKSSVQNAYFVVADYACDRGSIYPSFGKLLADL